MTRYADVKVDPFLRSVVRGVAGELYGQDYRAISRAGHEALIVWLLFRADPSTVEAILRSPGVYGLEDPDGDVDIRELDSVSDIVEYLRAGRFEGDDHFDPMAAARDITLPSDATGPWSDVVINNEAPYGGGGPDPTDTDTDH